MSRVLVSILAASVVVVVAGTQLATPTHAQNATTGRLKVKAEPGRAGVFVDGKYLGPAANFKRARTYTLPAGTHQVLLREPRYRDVTTTVTIDAGKTTEVKQKLEAVPLDSGPWGKLKTKAGAKYTAVYVDDRFMGHADEFDNFAQSLLLRPGDYQVKLVSADGARNHQEKVTITADKTTTVKWEGQ